MMKLLTIILGASVATAITPCDVCTDMVSTLTTTDQSDIVDSLCPLSSYDIICEDVLPVLVKWVQDDLTAVEVCSVFCDSLDVPGHHEHIFELPHPITDDNSHHHKHLFDLPHPENTGPLVDDDPTIDD